MIEQIIASTVLGCSSKLWNHMVSTYLYLVSNSYMYLLSVFLRLSHAFLVLATLFCLTSNRNHERRHSLVLRFRRNKYLDGS